MKTKIVGLCTLISLASFINAGSARASYYISSNIFHYGDGVNQWLKSAAVNQKVIGMNISMGSGGLNKTLNMISFTIPSGATSSPNDIQNARFWYTCQNNCGPVQFGQTVTTISGAGFSFTGSLSLPAGNLQFYLTFDITSTVTENVVVNAACQSLKIGGVFVALPTYDTVKPTRVSTYKASVCVFDGSSAFPGRTAKIMGIWILLNGNKPFSITQFNFTSQGTLSLSDISPGNSAKLWYTGNSSVFGSGTGCEWVPTGTLVGSTSVAGVFSINPNISIPAGYNYFWLTYDVSPTAVYDVYPYHVLSATCPSLVALGLTYMNGVPGPGATYIFKNNCLSNMTNSDGEGKASVRTSVHSSNGSSRFIINAPDDKNLLLEIYSIDGRLLERRTIAGQKGEMEVMTRRDLPFGMNIVRLSNGQESVALKYFIVR